MESIKQFMQRPRTTVLTAYCTGLVWYCLPTKPDVNVLTHPLSFLFFGSFYALFVTIGAKMVFNNMPDDFKPIIPIALTASSVYSILKEFY